jgi:hypothetical protein
MWTLDILLRDNVYYQRTPHLLDRSYWESVELRQIIDSFQEFFRKSHPEEAWPYRRKSKEGIDSKLSRSFIPGTTVVTSPL